MIAENKPRSIVRASNQLELAKIHARTAQVKQYSAHLNENLRSTRKRRRGWTIPDVPSRDFTPTDRRAASAKSRQKVEESPNVLGMMLRYIDNIVGSGYRLIMQSGDRDYDREVQERFNFTKDRFDIKGIRRWGRLQRMWQFRRVIDGDCGISLVNAGLENGEVLSRLQTFESENIRKNPADPLDTGIEYNRFGRPVKYYVGPRVTKTTEVDKKLKQGRPIDPAHFIHFVNFPHERVERGRGISQMLTTLNMIEDLDQILGAMIQKVKNEAFMGIFFGMETAPDGSIFGSELETGETTEDGKTRTVVKSIPVMNMKGMPGEKPEMMESKSPHNEFERFIRLVIRFIGSPLGLPLEMALFDFSDTNFSGGRAILELAKKRWRVEQDELAFVSSRIFNWWIGREIKHNGLTPPKSLPDRNAWRHRWGKPGWPYLDPSKEAAADGAWLDRGLTTHQNILAERTDQDFEEVIDELSAEYDYMSGKGVPIVAGLPGATVITGDGDRDEESELDEDGKSVDPDNRTEPAEPTEASALGTKEKLDTYGIAVRSGVITPQIDDENAIRSEMGLPKLSRAGEKAWKKDQCTRRPITLALPDTEE